MYYTLLIFTPSRGLLFCNIGSGRGMWLSAVLTLNHNLSSSPFLSWQEGLLQYVRSGAATGAVRAKQKSQTSGALHDHVMMMRRRVL